MRNLLTEIRTLAVAASNEGVNDPGMYQAYQAEVSRLTDTFNFIAENAAFGEQKLLDGSEGSLTAIGTLAGIDLSDSDSAARAIEYIDAESTRLDTSISETGATQKNSLESRLSNLMVESENLTAAESQIRDTDFVYEFSNFLKDRMLLQSSLSLLSHSFMTQQSVLALLVE
jgi:flagellin